MLYLVSLPQGTLVTFITSRSLSVSALCTLHEHEDPKTPTCMQRNLDNAALTSQQVDDHHIFAERTVQVMLRAVKSDECIKDAQLAKFMCLTGVPLNKCPRGDHTSGYVSPSLWDFNNLQL